AGLALGPVGGHVITASSSRPDARSYGSLCLGVVPGVWYIQSQRSTRRLYPIRHSAFGFYRSRAKSGEQDRHTGIVDDRYLDGPILLSCRSPRQQNSQQHNHSDPIAVSKPGVPVALILLSNCCCHGGLLVVGISVLAPNSPTLYTLDGLQRTFSLWPGPGERERAPSNPAR